MVRRGCGLTGVHAVAELLKKTTSDVYALQRGRRVKQIPLVADLLAESADGGVVNMLEALSARESEYFACEANVFSLDLFSETMFFGDRTSFWTRRGQRGGVYKVSVASRFPRRYVTMGRGFQGQSYCWCRGRR